MKAKAALLLILVVAGFGSAMLGAASASAYTTTRNWYSMTWYLNKSETWEARNKDAVDFGAIIGLKYPIAVALTAYWGSFSWIAYQARLRNACEAITWIYVNLPYPWIYQGPDCH